MDIYVTESMYLHSNMYMLSEKEHIILIDPCENYQLPEKAVLEYIFLTHEHYDHISGVNYWRNCTDAKVICSVQCSENIADSKRNLSRYFDVFQKMQTWVTNFEYIQVMPYKCSADIVFTGKMELEWHGHRLEVFETPGHSKGSCCIQLDDQWLFSGDVLMKDFPISCGLPGGSKRDWLNKSKPVLKGLSGDITVLPGHFGSFQLKEYKYWEAVSWHSAE